MRANRLISDFHFKYLPLFGGNFVLPVTPGYAVLHPGLRSAALSELIVGDVRPSICQGIIECFSY